MRINKQEARLLSMFVQSGLEDFFQQYRNLEATGAAEPGTAKALRAGLASLTAKMAEYSEDGRGNGRWNPNTDDMPLKELGRRVYRRRYEALKGTASSYGIYDNPEDYL